MYCTISAISCDCVVIHLVVTALYSPLMKVHALMLRVSYLSVTVSTKDVNLAVVSTNDIDQGIFPFVVTP